MSALDNADYCSVVQINPIFLIIQFLAIGVVQGVRECGWVGVGKKTW